MKLGIGVALSTLTLLAAATFQVQNLHIVEDRPDGFILGWDTVVGASAYEVYKDVSVINGTPGWRYATSTDNLQTFSGLQPGACTTVQVAAIVNGVVQQRSAPSNLCVSSPYQVKNISQQSVDHDSFIAQWDIVPGATAYEVYRDVSVVNGTPGWKYATSTDNLQGFTGFQPSQCTLIQVAAIVNGVVQQRSAPATLCTTAAPPPAERAASVHPFSSSAFINTSVGSGIQFAPASDPRNADLLEEGTGLASARWSVRVVEAKETDPIVTLRAGVNSGSPWTVTRPDGQPIRIPVDAEPGLGTDNHLAIIQTDKRTLVEGWLMKEVDDTHWDSGYAGTVDLLGDGREFGARASGISQIHGQITKEEVASGRINHALSLGIDNHQLKYIEPGGADGRTAGVWPARRQDGDARTAYTGSIPMGQMFAIPGNVNINALGLTPEGLSIARALQDYGAYVLIRSASTNLTAEPDAEALYPAKVQNMRTDWAKLRPYLRAVANSTETSVAGGGTPKLPPLPPVVAR